YVYVLVSATRNYKYVGLTNDVDRRLAEHNAGYNKSTAPYRPFSVLFIESFPSRGAARQREKFLKSGQGRDLVKLILDERSGARS
ncbi:GIY-YIG nuclease family protein, partial [Arthrospira platensis SPKY2]